MLLNHVNFMLTARYIFLLLNTKKITRSDTHTNEVTSTVPKEMTLSLGLLNICGRPWQNIFRRYRYFPEHLELKKIRFQTSR